MALITGVFFVAQVSLTKGIALQMSLSTKFAAQKHPKSAPAHFSPVLALSPVIQFWFFL